MDPVLRVAPGRRIPVWGLDGQISPGLDEAKELRSSTPAVWVVQLGTNDIAAEPLDRARYRELVTTMLDTIGADVPVVWVNVHRNDRPEASRAFDDTLRLVARTWPNLTIADWDAVAGNEQVLAADGIHLGAGGRRPVRRDDRRSPSARPVQRPAPCPDGPSSARCRRPSRSRTTSRRLLVSSSPAARASPSTRLVSRRCTPASPASWSWVRGISIGAAASPALVRVQLGQRHDAAVDAHGPRDVGQLGHLAGEPVDHRDEDADQQAVDLRVLLAQLLELAPADDERLRRLDGLDGGSPDGGPVEEGLLAEEVAGAHERHGERVAVRTADEHGDPPADDQVERVPWVALVDEVGAPAVLPPPAPLEERGARLLRQRGEERRVGAHGRATLPSAHQCAVDVRTAP